MKRPATALAIALLTVTACSGTVTPPPPAPQASTSASATGTTTEQPSAAAGPVVLSFLTLPQEVAKNEEAWVSQIKRFEAANPGITVNRETLPTQEFVTVLQTRLQSGQAPDVFQNDTSPGTAGVLAKAGLLLDLTPYYDQYQWDVFDWAKARATFQGKVRAIPTGVEELGIFYNKNMFAEMGLSVPATLAEFEAAMDTLKAKGITPLAFGDQPKWPAGHQFSMVLGNLIGRSGLDDILYGNGHWNDPAGGTRAIDIFFKQFRDKGYFPKDPNAITYEDANALFFAGKAAMISTGTWLIPQIEAETQGKFDVGFFPFPSIDGKPVATPVGLGSGNFVSASTRHPAEAAKFLDWMLSAETQRFMVETLNTLPANPIDTTGFNIGPLFGQVVHDLSSANNDSQSYNIDVLTPAGFNNQMMDGFQEVLGGQLTPQEQADKLEAAWQKAKAAGDILKAP